MQGGEPFVTRGRNEISPTFACSRADSYRYDIGRYPIADVRAGAGIGNQSGRGSQYPNLRASTELGMELKVFRMNE